MIEPLFFEALYWFFMNNQIVLLTTGVITSTVGTVVLLTVTKKWGESY